MTDKEIIKALECCISAESCCVCGYTKMCDGTTIHQFALDLINRQKAEIDQYAQDQHELMIEMDKLFDTVEKQKAEIERLKIEKDNLIRTYAECQAEAVKEFIERLKTETVEVDVSCGYGKEHYTEAVTVIAINNLAKETVGDE
jgi:hypothetical protein